MTGQRINRNLNLLTFIKCIVWIRNMNLHCYGHKSIMFTLNRKGI